RKSLPRHRAVPLAALDAYEPGIARDGLRAAFVFSDAQVEFPERLTVDAVRDFTDAGGVALNHTEAARIISPGGILRGLDLRTCAGEGAEVRASDAERHDPLIGGTKGSHLVANWPQGPEHAVFASAKSDGRPFFILPWYRYTLIGTTDLRYDGDPSAARATAAEVRYLLDEANRLFPAAPLRREDVLYTYC